MKRCIKGVEQTDKIHPGDKRIWSEGEDNNVEVINTI